MSRSRLNLQRQPPFSIMWKTVSESCNLACDYCYYSRCGGRPGKIERIDPLLLEKVIREYMSLTKGAASFVWQGGEPLLAGLDFFQQVVALQIKYAPDHAIISNSLQTNATLIDDDWARFFKKYNFLIGVSLDGPKEIHDRRRITGSGKGSFDRVMEGIAFLKKYNVDFNILTVIHEGNVDKAKELMQFYRRHRFRYIQFIPCMDFRSQETEKEGKYRITPEQYGRFLCDVFDEWYDDDSNMFVRFFDNMLSIYLHQEAELCIHRSSCPTMLVLEQNGDAYPCDFYIHDQYKLGNVRRDSLLEILSKAVHHGFKKMKPNLPHQCTSCEYLRLCHGGCPRNRQWGDVANNVDYFCESYKKIYQYAGKRMESLAQKIKSRRLAELIERGYKLPRRNEPCICGSGKKFKKCCRPLLAALEK